MLKRVPNVYSRLAWFNSSRISATETSVKSLQSSSFINRTFSTSSTYFSSAQQTDHKENTVALNGSSSSTPTSSLTRSESSSSSPATQHSSIAYQKTWTLPQISKDGEIIDEKLQKLKQTGNRLGTFIDNRPKVPPNWRSNKTLEPWQRQMFALKEKFHNEGWKPKKRLSRGAMEGIRKLKEFEPTLTTKDIAKEFKVSAESIRRILKSKWRPTQEELEDINDRWRKRGEILHTMKSNSNGHGNRNTRNNRSFTTKKSHQSRKMRASPDENIAKTDIGNEFF